MSDSIRIERDARLATLTIDRPPLNILDLTAIAALEAAVEELAGEENLQLLIIRGAGDRAFSAGVAVEDHTADRVEELISRFHAAVQAVRHFPTATLAVINGHCLGGGMELAAGCDMVLASTDSRFGQPEIKLGCFPPLAAALYPTLLGMPRAFDLLLTGRTIDCDEATRIGFVGRQVPAADMVAAVDEMTGQILEHSLAVTRLTTKALRAARNRTFEQALEASEQIYLGDLAATADMHEGIAAFLEKRQPQWNHK